MSCTLSCRGSQAAYGAGLEVTVGWLFTPLTDMKTGGASRLVSSNLTLGVFYL